MVELSSEHTLVLFGELNDSLPSFLNISLENGNIRINEMLDLLGGESIFELLDSVSLLVFLEILVLFVELFEVQLVVEVIRVDEASLGVVRHVIISAIQFGAATSTAVNNFVWNEPPSLNKPFSEDEQAKDQDCKPIPNKHMGLPKSFSIEIESLIPNELDGLWSPDIGVPVHQESEAIMQNEDVRQHLDDGSWNLASIPWRLLVVVEDEIFVNPVLNKNDEKVEDVKWRNSWAVGKGHKDCEQDLGVSYFENELWSCVEVLIVILNDLSGSFGVEVTLSIVASNASKPNGLKKHKEMWEYQHACLSKDDDWTDIKEPFNIELSIHAYENIGEGVSLEDLIWCDETILSQNDKNGGVNEWHEGNISHDRNIIFWNVLVSHMISNKVENVCNDNVNKGDPSSQSLGRERFDVSNFTPVFAVLQSIGK